jgi:hypothetical protein
MPVSLVTPSTIAAISSPKRSRTSSIEAEVSSTVSCSSAAHSVSVSRRMLAQIRATPTGCTMKSSPDLRRCAAWCSQANTNASWTRARSMCTAESAACSETIAKRSLSRRRSEVLRPTGGGAAAPVAAPLPSASDDGGAAGAAGRTAGACAVAAPAAAPPAPEPFGSSVMAMIKG